MKTWRWMLVMMLAGTIAAACSDDTDTTDTTQSTSSSSASVTASSSSTGAVTSSSSTGMSSCDSGAAGEFDFSNALCQPCAQCALMGNCSDALALCPSFIGNGTGTACDLYRDCQTDCSDTALSGCATTCDTECTADPMGMPCADCLEECRLDCIGIVDMGDPPTGSCLDVHATGAQQNLDLLSCVVCQECPNNCDGVNVCTGG